MQLRESSYRVYGRLKRAVAPELKHAQDVYTERLGAFVNDSVGWLDLGCGHQVLPDWHREEERRYTASCRMIVGVDADLPSLAAHQTISLKTKGDISRLPFKDESFELVTANMVVEHLEHPDAQFREVARVLKPGGHCVLLTPSAYGYPTVLARYVPDGLKRRLVWLLDGRRSADVFRTHYRANTPRRLEALAQSSGFSVVGIERVASEALFAVVPPVAAIELVWIKALLKRPLRELRPNLMAVFQKRAG